eukprot:XP_016659359.1 PREDICTED: uncharacterized protein LOC107883600 isoform X2 [Acyrthosiphon pisum]
MKMLVEVMLKVDYVSSINRYSKTSKASKSPKLCRLPCPSVRPSRTLNNSVRRAEIAIRNKSTEIRRLSFQTNDLKTYLAK